MVYVTKTEMMPTNRLLNTAGALGACEYRSRGTIVRDGAIRLTPTNHEVRRTATIPGEEVLPAVIVVVIWPL